jgi:uncharacterized Ntn-hydrolase superfamily protein
VKVSLAGVTTSSVVVATPQQNRSGVDVQSAIAATGSFTIYLNKSVATKLLVGYFVLN